jgi:SAM-dependent methyltransferase
MQYTYSEKPAGYFDTARKGFVDELPVNSKGRLLEIGTGAGDTAAYAKAEGKCGWCCGVELCEGPAEVAKSRLDRVIVGNVENLTLDLEPRSINVMLLSEVLEHLVDPWSVLRRLRPLAAPGAIIMAGSPNVCHRSVIGKQLRGLWPSEERGIFDSTHLRWFSPSSYRAMFETCGYTVYKVGPAYPLRFKARIFNRLTFGRLEYLLHSQIWLRARAD